MSRGISTALVLLWTAAGCAEPSGGGAATVASEGAGTEQPAPPAEAVLTALGRMETREFWPGFRPDTIPLALYDGDRTWLAGYGTAAPDGFAPAEGGLLVHEGRHPAVRGNMPTRMGDRAVAVVLLPILAGSGARQAAAVAVHEKFHVHQNVLHPDWGANELARFAYPVADPQGAFLRRLETRALANAASAADPSAAACWLSTASVLRQRRFAVLPAEAVEYERALERTEGLAEYIERKAEGGERAPGILASGFAPDDVRGRAYRTGDALARALDVVAPGWQERFDQAAMPALDSLLAHEMRGSRAGSCGFSADERRDVHEEVSNALGVLEARRSAALRDFESADGWSVVLVAGAEPLWPQSFDPMNVQMLGEGRLLHGRALRMGNAGGSLETWERPALTLGEPASPLGRGAVEMRVSGLEARPTLRRTADGGHELSAEGLTGRFGPGSRIEEGGQRIIVRLP